MLRGLYRYALILTAMVSLVLLHPSVVRAAGVVVNCNDSGVGSLRGAIVGGGLVTFAPGLNCSSTGAGPILLTSGTLQIVANTTIDGTGATIVVDGNNAATVFMVNSGLTATIKGLTVQHGAGTHTGCVGSYTCGGGIFNDHGTLTVANSTLTNNNGADFGGGINNFGGTLTVTNSTITGNSVGFHGGGIYSSGGGSFTVTNSTFAGNSAPAFGGGIFNSSMLTVTNSTFVGNSAPLGGGGIDNFLTLVATNCTFSGNSSNGIDNAYGQPSDALLVNTIVANSAGGGDLASGIGSFSGNHNLIDDATSAGGFIDGVNGNIVGHPALLGTLGNYGGPTQTIPILPGSPAIDAGASGPGIPTTDQRGVPRVGPPDIGAFEATSLTQITITPTNATLKVGQVQQFTATATYADSSMANITSQVTWTSDASAVASVDATGKVTGVTAGTAHIMATRGAIVGGPASVTVTAPTPIGLSVPLAPSGRPSGTTSLSGSGSPAAAPNPVPVSTPPQSSGTSSGAAPAPVPTGR